MKTETVSVSLPVELAEFARQDMTLEAYGGWNEYLRDLVRRRRQDRIQKDVRALEATIKGAPAADPGPAFYKRVAVVQREVRPHKKRRT
jgi:Arc/MetJ-type ribon-helix-helix transcriptional regulator